MAVLWSRGLCDLLLHKCQLMRRDASQDKYDQQYTDKLLPSLWMCFDELKRSINEIPCRHGLVANKLYTVLNHLQHHFELNGSHALNLLVQEHCM